MKIIAVLTITHPKMFNLPQKNSQKIPENMTLSKQQLLKNSQINIIKKFSPYNYFFIN
jgi:hypothetical protein